MSTYIPSQDEEVGSNMRTEGVLLYPATDEVPDSDVTAEMHGHAFRVLTVDFGASPMRIRSQLLSLTKT